MGCNRGGGMVDAIAASPSPEPSACSSSAGAPGRGNAAAIIPTNERVTTISFGALLELTGSPPPGGFLMCAYCVSDACGGVRPSASGVLRMRIAYGGRGGACVLRIAYAYCVSPLTTRESSIDRARMWVGPLAPARPRRPHAVACRRPHECMLVTHVPARMLTTPRIYRMPQELFMHAFVSG